MEVEGSAGGAGREAALQATPPACLQAHHHARLILLVFACPESPIIALSCPPLAASALQGYSSGSGVLGGIARGLLGAVGLPVRHALPAAGLAAA